MSFASKLARSIVPAPLRRPLKKILDQTVRLASSPFESPLAREIHHLEHLSGESPLSALGDFPELESSAWQGLQGLAYQIVRHYKPRVVVELGTHMGLSALAMGIALRDLGEGGVLYAVDSWEGDPQAGKYGEADDHVYTTFLKRREQLGLDQVIIPLKMYFDEARDKVATPIDLLHVDGLHTWDAVKHDWETFGPLVRPGGLALFHDVNTYFEGVTKFWATLKLTHETCTIPYSFGLGILKTKAQA